MKYTYTFNQLRDCPGENTERLFLCYEETVRHFGAVDLSRYFTADYGTVEASSQPAACEKLYEIYNVNRPEGYHGRSMSVSDVVVLWNNETDPPQRGRWYCDSFGFRLLT